MGSGLRLLAFVLAGEGTAHAASEKVRVDYDAPAECPDAASFRNAVLARTERAELVTSGETPRSFSVRLIVFNGKALGRLELREAGGVTTARDLSSDRCDDVVAGLALTAALAIDPEALLPKKSPAAESPVIVAPRSSVSPAPARTHVVFGMALAPLVATGVGNVAAIGAMLALDATFETSGAFAPRVRVWGGHARTDIISVGGSADFAWTIGTLLVAPVRLPRRGAFGLRPYVVSHLGILDAWGLGVRNPKSAALGWFDVGLGLQAELELSRHFAFELDGSAAIPITRLDFAFDSPRMVVYEAPWIAGVVSVGAHVAF